MDKKLSPFQMIMFALLVVVIIAGVVVFALQRQGGKDRATPITMWGTISEDIINDLQLRINDAQESSVEIIYTEFNEDEFEAELIEALASGTGPDTAILSDDMILPHENKLFLINYEFYPQEQFLNNFIEAGEVLLREEGILGFPLTIDPMVLYWNRTILNNEGISTVPDAWDQFLTLVPKLVIRDSASNISRAGVALGEFRNINNAKEILVSLIQQAGNQIIIRDSIKQSFVSIFEDRLGYKVRPTDTAVNFFVQFGDPAKSVYSWNRSLPRSDEMFLAGDLAFYFGFASERREIIEKNPNLNFSVTMLPQSRSSSQKSTVARMNFVTILNKSSNITAAYNTLLKITAPENISFLSEITLLPPVRREIIDEVPDLAFQDVFNRSALIAQTFIDPDALETSDIFQSMIESVISGSQGTSEAINRASGELRLLLSE